MPSKWPTGAADLSSDPWFAQAEKRNTPRGSSGAGSGKPAFSDRWAKLSSAMLEWIEGRCNPTRRHATLVNLSPMEFERLHILAATTA